VTQLPADAEPREIDLEVLDAIIDVRPHAPTTARIENSLLIRLEDLLEDPAASIPSLQARILITCDMGVRSLLAVERLRAMGYERVMSLAGGIDAWRHEGFPLVGAGGLTDAQLDRYDRHLKLESIGVAGQLALLDANAVVVGAGGLGSPVIAYLAAAGVGTITIIDDDAVDTSNLQRQPLHTTADVGRAKVASAASFVRSLNPDVDVITRAVRLDDQNAKDLLEGATVIVDASDNFAARYAINDAAVELGVPVVFASVYRMEGQVAVFDAAAGPCYRCVYPRPPDHDMPLDCQMIGVLGAITGVLGSIQATEAIKLIVGSAEPSTGRLLIYDGSSQSFTTLPVAKDPSCPTCG